MVPTRQRRHGIPWGAPEYTDVRAGIASQLALTQDITGHPEVPPMVAPGQNPQPLALAGGWYGAAEVGTLGSRTCT